MNGFLHSGWQQLQNRHSLSHRLGLGLIVLVGFLLRYYSLAVGQAYHYSALNDEVSALSSALQLLAGEPRAFYIGQPFFAGAQIPGPLWALFVAACYKLGGSSAEGAIFCMLLVNSVVVYLVYRLARHFLTPDYALLSALVYAVSAWPVFFAAGLWNPLPLALLSALLYLALWDVSRNEASPNIFWVCLLSASLPQFHMIAVFAYPAIILILVLGTTRLNRKWLTLGLLAGLALYLPYLLGDAAHGWENLRKLGSEPATFSFSVLKILTTPITVLSNHPGNWAGDGFDKFREFGDAAFGSYLVLLLLNVGSLLLSAFFFINPIRRFIKAGPGGIFSLRQRYANDPALGFLVILMVVPLLVFLVTGKNYSTRYTLLGMPLLFVLPGLFISRLADIKTQRLVLAAFGGMLLAGVYVLLSFYHDLGHHIDTDAQFHPSFRQLSRLEQTLLQDAGPAMITIDASGFIKDEGEATYITGHGIKDYVEAMSAFRQRGKPADTNVTYILQNAGDNTAASMKIIYSVNGIKLSRLQSD